MADDSPHKICIKHEGLEGKLYLLIALGLLSAGIQVYAVQINSDTRENLIRSSEKISGIETRVSMLERLISKKERSE